MAWAEEAQAETKPQDSPRMPRMAAKWKLRVPATLLMTPNGWPRCHALFSMAARRRTVRRGEPPEAA